MIYPCLPSQLPHIVLMVLLLHLLIKQLPLCQLTQLHLLLRILELLPLLLQEHPSLLVLQLLGFLFDLLDPDLVLLLPLHVKLQFLYCLLDPQQVDLLLSDDSLLLGC